MFIFLSILSALATPTRAGWYDDGSFEPDAVATRAEALQKIAEFQGQEQKLPTAPVTPPSPGTPVRAPMPLSPYSRTSPGATGLAFLRPTKNYAAVTYDLDGTGKKVWIVEVGANASHLNNVEVPVGVGSQFRLCAYEETPGSGDIKFVVKGANGNYYAPDDRAHGTPAIIAPSTTVTTAGLGLAVKTKADVDPELLDFKGATARVDDARAQSWKKFNVSTAATTASTLVGTTASHIKGVAVATLVTEVGKRFQAATKKEEKLVLYRSLQALAEVAKDDRTEDTNMKPLLDAMRSDLRENDGIRVEVLDEPAKDGAIKAAVAALKKATPTLTGLPGDPAIEDLEKHVKINRAQVALKKTLTALGTAWATNWTRNHPGEADPGEPAELAYLRTKVLVLTTPRTGAAGTVAFTGNEIKDIYDEAKKLTADHLADPEMQRQLDELTKGMQRVAAETGDAAKAAQPLVAHSMVKQLEDAQTAIAGVTVPAASGYGRFRGVFVGSGPKQRARRGAAQTAVTQAQKDSLRVFLDVVKDHKNSVEEAQRQLQRLLDSRAGMAADDNIAKLASDTFAKFRDSKLAAASGTGTAATRGKASAAPTPVTPRLKSLTDDDRARLLAENEGISDSITAWHTGTGSIVKGADDTLTAEITKGTTGSAAAQKLTPAAQSAKRIQDLFTNFDEIQAGIKAARASRWRAVDAVTPWNSGPADASDRLKELQAMQAHLDGVLVGMNAERDKLSGAAELARKTLAHRVRLEARDLDARIKTLQGFTDRGMQRMTKFATAAAKTTAAPSPSRRVVPGPLPSSGDSPTASVVSKFTSRRSVVPPLTISPVASDGSLVAPRRGDAEEAKDSVIDAGSDGSGSRGTPTRAVRMLGERSDSRSSFGSTRSRDSFRSYASGASSSPKKAPTSPVTPAHQAAQKKFDVSATRTRKPTGRGRHYVQ